VAIGLPWLLLLIPPALGLVWWWYRRRRPPERKVAGLWLWQKAIRKGKARRRFDLRLFLLLLSALLGLLALSAPKVWLDRPGELVVVLDASASMGATDLSPSRLERAKEIAREHLRASPRAVLVIASGQIQTFGPSLGRGLTDNLEGLQATATSVDLKTAIARGRALLPEAPVLTITDQPAPPGTDGYINVAGNGTNLGITAIGPGFVAVANAGPGLWRGELLVDGRRYPLEVPARGFSSLELTSRTPTARIVGNDALALDNQARFSRRLVRVEVTGRSPALERLLALLGTSRGSPSEMAFEIGTPSREPSLFTVFFAQQASGQATVFDVERTIPYLRGAELVGYSLRIPPRPTASNWQPLAISETGQALAWYHPNGVYLPPAESLQNLPAFPVLLYNLTAPRGELRSGLLAPAETLLPRPSPDQPLPPTLTVQLAPWLALLAALLLAVEFYFFQYRTGRERLETQTTPAT